MIRPISFALFADPLAAAPAFEEMADAVAARTGLRLAPVWVASYAALGAALEHGAARLGWLPPLVAHDLEEAGVGAPLAAVVRKERTTYYSILVARPGSTLPPIASLSRASAGWVSKLSAAGYVVPRLYLRSRGWEPNDLFGEQRFFGSHARVGAALAAGEVDVAATYATLTPGGRALVFPRHVPPTSRVLAAAGPVPGDVVFASASLEAKIRDAVRAGLVDVRAGEDGALAQTMGVDRFAPAAPDHFDLLRVWRRRAAESEPPRPASAPVAAPEHAAPHARPSPSA